MEAQRFLSRVAPQVEAWLEAALPPEDAPPRSLHRAMRYAVLGGGKRLRPAMVLAAAEVVRPGSSAALLRPACALELLHAYTLVHDDLPCMDDDDERRGRPSTHRAFGEALAVLTGDALQALAFAWLAEPPAGASAERSLSALARLANAAGPAGVVGGQVLDLAASGRLLGEEAPLDLADVH
ncbi:MAG: polyprenyl synthetase family protein, partial [Clostridia bacterium]|nr:polyprenyl synthetase family protein [Clostridia bacterium]